MKSRIVQGLAVAGCYGCIIAVIIEYGKKAGMLCILALLFHAVVMAAIEAREERKEDGK